MHTWRTLLADTPDPAAVGVQVKPQQAGGRADGQVGRHARCNGGVAGARKPRRRRARVWRGPRGRGRRPGGWWRQGSLCGRDLKAAGPIATVTRGDAVLVGACSQWDIFHEGWANVHAEMSRREVRAAGTMGAIGSCELWQVEVRPGNPGLILGCVYLCKQAGLAAK